MKKILFQGDSITDVGRNTERGSLVSLGQGYALISAASLGARHPGQFQFVNTGISGSRVVDVYARIKADCWNHNPDVISLLIGVNDVWHEVGGKNGVDARRFENVYRMLIEDTLLQLPKVKIMAMEPFILNGSACTGLWDYFREETALRGEAVRKVAAEYSLTFLPLQEMFNRAAEQTGNPDLWLGDGVHPTPAGHQLIAEAWLAAFNEKILPSLGD